MDRRLARRLVALAAAYAVVLNTLLPLFSALVLPAADAAIGLAVICSASGAGAADDRGVPQRPQPPCPCCGACAMPGCGAAALPDLASTGAGAARIGAGPVALSHDGRERQAFWPGGSKLARAPPLA
jgi:hypothetical protein